MTRLTYPLDYSGVSPTNTVMNEPVTWPSDRVLVFSPLYAPFNSSSIAIVDKDTYKVLTTDQYKLFNVCEPATVLAPAGVAFYHTVLITDKTVSRNLTVSYQTVGDKYCTGYDAIVNMIKLMANDNRDVDWSNIINMNDSLSRSPHIHSLAKTLGWEYVVNQLGQIAIAILAGDQVKKQEVVAYIQQATNNLNQLRDESLVVGPLANHIADTGNPHGMTLASLGLDNVKNYAIATLAEVLEGTPERYVTGDQVTSVVTNALSKGIDAHTLDKNNPHGDTAATVGLNKVQNYGLATLGNMNAPDENDPKYVTDTVFKVWFDAYTTAQDAELNSYIAAITGGTIHARGSLDDLVAQTKALTSVTSSIQMGHKALLDMLQKTTLLTNNALADAQAAKQQATSLLTDYLSKMIR